MDTLIALLPMGKLCLASDERKNTVDDPITELIAEVHIQFFDSIRDFSNQTSKICVVFVADNTFVNNKISKTSCIHTVRCYSHMLNLEVK